METALKSERRPRRNSLTSASALRRQPSRQSRKNRPQEPGMTVEEWDAWKNSMVLPVGELRRIPLLCDMLQLEKAQIFRQNSGAKPVSARTARQCRSLSVCRDIGLAPVVEEMPDGTLLIEVRPETIEAAKELALIQQGIKAMHDEFRGLRGEALKAAREERLSRKGEKRLLAQAAGRAHAGDDEDDGAEIQD